MQDRWFKAGLFVICLGLGLGLGLGMSTPAYATAYDIYPDGTFTANSKCSLDQALQAINTQQSLIKVGTGSSWISTAPAATDKVICVAGSGSDSLNFLPQDEHYYDSYKVADAISSDSDKALAAWLENYPSYASYQAAVVYSLTQAIEVGGQGKNINLTIQLKRRTFDNKTQYANAVINAPTSPSNRAIFVHSGSLLTLKSITLTGGDVSTQVDGTTAIPPVATSPNGGVIYAQGSLALLEGTQILGGKAVNGAGVYLDAASNGIVLKLTNAIINGNTASANGGGVGMAPGSTVVISGFKFNVFNNTAANGGGIYLDGKSATLALLSGTFYGNSATTAGAAIDVVAGVDANASRETLLNNVTLVGNTGSAALHYGDICQHATSPAPPALPVCDLHAPPGAATDPNDVINTWVPDPVKRVDRLYNSVVVGNVNAGCAFTTSGTPEQYLENAYSISAAASGCPAAEQWMSTDSGPATGNGGGAADTAGVGVLTGADTANPSTPCAAATCTPIDFGASHYHLQGFMPTPFDVSAPVYPTLINGASPNDATGNLVCAATDERGKGRSDRCDAGALEMTIARGVLDSLDRISAGQTTWLDVVKNDLGDVGIDCTKVALDCLSFPLPSKYASSLTVVYVAGPLADKADGTQVFTTTTNPGVVASADPGHTYPLIEYRSAAGFHGQDQFTYQVATGVLDGPADAGVMPLAQVQLSVAPVDDFESADISDFKSGGIGGGLLAALLLLGFCRRKARCIKPSKVGQHQGRGVLLALLLAMAGVAQADVAVNAVDGIGLSAAAVDPGIAGDHYCALREALSNTFEYPVANPDCDFGAPGADTITLPAGTITLRSNLTIAQSNVVTLEGAGVDKSIIDGAGIYRINTSSGLTLRYLVLQNAHGAQGGAIFTNTDLTLDHVALLNNKADNEGGAIYLNYGSDVGFSHTLAISSSYFKGNTAKSGGAISTVGQSQKFYLSIYNSTFDGNQATAGEGGAIDANLAEDGKLDVVNSIFTANSATNGAAAIDLSDANATTVVNLLNSTFVDNTGGDFLDVGNNIANVNLSHSIITGTGTATLGCSAGSGQLKGDFFNLFADGAGVPEPITCSATQPADNDVATAAAVTAELGALKDGVDTSCNLNDADEDKAATCKLDVTSHYVPPLFELSASSTLIKDMGNPASQASGIATASACRTTDMRGKSRGVGAACDLGAYEVQLMTAKDEAVSTLTVRNDGKLFVDREARADVLANDIPGEGTSGAYTIVTDQIGFLTTTGKTILKANGANSVELADIAAGTYTESNNDSPAKTANLVLLGITSDGTIPLTGINGTLTWVKMAKDDPACAAGDECGLKLSMTCDDLAHSTSFVGCAALKAAMQSDQDNGLTYADASAQINATNDPNNLVCPDNNTPDIKIPYVVYDSNNNVSNALLSVKLADVPPQFSNSVITVYTKPDEPVSFALNASDPDGIISDVSIPDNGDPMFAAEDPVRAQQKHDTGDKTIHPAWGVGVKWNGSTTNPMLTYIRGNKTQVFNDRFTIQLKDNCGKTALVTVIVKFPHVNAAGGDLLAGGSLGWGLALLLCLGLVRRRY